ncbi:MAG TPA: DMT family transporter [Gaiellales bacterium]|nr:DMT family transporter [Gaiellales bacterium]
MATSAAIDSISRSQHRRGQTYVALAALAWSTAGVLQRELHVGLGTQVAGRALFAFVALALFVAAGQWRDPASPMRGSGWAMVGVSVSTALASGSFIVALNYSTVANVLFLQAAAPMVAALLAWLMLSEPVSRRSWIAMLIALAGVGVMVGAPGNGGILVTLLTIVIPLSFAVSIVITRHHRHMSMAPATALAQILILVCAAPFAHPGSVNERNLVLLILLGAGQIGLGLALLSIGARLLPAAEIATITLLEVVLGPLWVWMAVSERPASATLVGGAVVIAAVLLQASAEPPAPAAEVSPPPP